MKVKILSAKDENTLEKNINEFIENPQIKVLKIEFAASVYYFSVMILYEDA